MSIEEGGVIIRGAKSVYRKKIIGQDVWLPLKNHSQRQKWRCRGRREPSHWFRRSILSRWICCWRTCSQNSFAHWTPQNWHWIPTYCHLWTIWNVAIFLPRLNFWLFLQSKNESHFFVCQLPPECELPSEWYVRLCDTITGLYRLSSYFAFCKGWIKAVNS